MKTRTSNKTTSMKLKKSRKKTDNTEDFDEDNEDTEKSLNNKNKSMGSSSICEVCNKKLRSRYHLKLHMAVHTGEKNYICGICHKGYQQKWNLITHVARVHSKEKPFKCNDCGKAFGYSSHFKRHVKTHFLEKIEAPETVKKRILNPYKCEFCEKSFESNYRLDLHLRVHTGTRPYVCEKCGKSFTTRRLCSIHIKKKHTLEFSCDHCGKTFVDRSAIAIHLKTEHNLSQDNQLQSLELEKNKDQSKKELIACEVCGKAITRASVKKHLNIHYRNRLYSCRYCEKQFLESGQRMVHERKHTGEKPYLCDICGRGHTQYGNLLTHRKRYHNLVGKTPKLWKRNANLQGDHETTKYKVINEAVRFVGNSQASATPQIDILNNDNRVYDNVTTEDNNSTTVIINSSENNEGGNTKPKYTGNETIEQFLKIASSWVNKKFEESKNSKSDMKKDFKNQEDLNKEHLIERYLEDENFSEAADSPDEMYSTVDSSSNQETISEIEKVLNTNQNEKEKKEHTTKEVKEIKIKMNKLIYEKIIESLQKDSEKDLVVEKINDKLKNGQIDVLREFLKLMKTVPENAVMKTKDGILFWHCWLCESRLRSRHLLARHLLIHEPEENRPYKCEVCRKTFTQSNNFKEHIMSHYNENQFCCEKCGCGFRHKSHFNMHMRRHNPTTNNPPPKKYECLYCGKKLNTNYQKLEHERTHTREKPFLCKVCGQQFGALSTLNRHHSTHSSVRHQCVVCLKLFRQKSSLKRHYGTHSEYSYRRVSCECGKTFSQSPSLKKHKMICKNRVEPVVKPFGCLVCSKRFLTKSDLNRHMATHDSSKRFKCPVCLTNLKTDETFKRHLKRHEQSQNKGESLKT